VDPLAVDEVSRSHTHVTILRDFSPLTDGLVEIVLRKDGAEQSFNEELPLRAGIFDVTILPTAEGVYDLSFRIEGPGRTEEIPAGQVRVGTKDDPGGLDGAVAEAGEGEEIPFLKEQQWKTAFSTAAAADGELHRVARGPGRVRPVAGGERIIAAPMSAIVEGDPWPWVGREVVAGDEIFTLTPYVAADRSLAELQAVETQKHAALEVAEERLKRLESLLPVQAASLAEVEEARADVTSLRAQHEAAHSDLRTARAGRSGAAADGAAVPVMAPFAGQIADVRVSPGQVVPAGAALGRVVRVEPFWVEVYLRPADALGIETGEVGLALRGSAMATAVSIDPERIRLVSRSPEVSPLNGTVTCIFEVAGDASPLLGSAVEAEVTLPEKRPGIVVPASAIVDDGGTPVVFVQHDGETFLRRQVELGIRQGASVVVRGVSPGERVVTVGGATIRRAALAASGVGHGHVH
jgi:RND family efflux transporter MFP subunit